MSVPLDWMYKKPTVDTEAYLLGKPVDKSLEQFQNAEANGCPTSNEDIGVKPGALFLEAAASAKLEADVKIREDPLYMIKKKEEEQRRMLLNNPVRLKKLQEELERQKQSDAKKHKSASDTDLLSKMMKLKSMGTDVRRILSEEVAHSSKTKSHDRNHRHRHHREEEEGQKRSRSRSSSPKLRRKQSDSRREQTRNRHLMSHSGSADRKRRKSPSPVSHRTSHHEKSSRSPRRRSNSPARSHRGSEKSQDRHPTSKPSSVPVKKFHPPEKHSRATGSYSSKYDPAELERKRQEMMADAQVRDTERSKNVAHYQKVEESDEARNTRLASGSSGGFIRPMLEAAAQASTLESRLKTNRHKSQRTRADLDKNFSQR